MAKIGPDGQDAHPTRVETLHVTSLHFLWGGRPACPKTLSEKIGARAASRSHMGHFFATNGIVGKYVLVKPSVARKDERLLVAPLGEYYDDLLAVYAFVTDRTKSTQGNFLLCEKLREEEPKVRESVAYLAKKRGVDPEKLWNHILKGEAKKISPEEIVESERAPTQ